MAARGPRTSLPAVEDGFGGNLVELQGGRVTKLRSGQGLVVAAIAVAVCCSLPATAAATDYCAGPALGCLPANSFGTDLQGALDEAESNPGPDRVLVGQGTYTRQNGFAYNDTTPANSVEIRGVGFPQPTLTMTTMSPAVEPTVLTVLHGNSSLYDLSLVIPNSGNQSRGVDLQGGTAEGLHVTGPPDPPGLFQTGIRGGAVTLSHNDVNVSTSQATGIRITGALPGATIRDSTVTAARGIRFDGPGAVFNVRRTSISAGLTGLHIFSGELSIDNSLIDMRGGTAGAEEAVDVNAAASDATVNAQQLTVRNGDPNTTGISATASFAGVTAEVDLSNSIIDGVGPALSRAAAAGATAGISTTNSNYENSGNVDTGAGAGAIAETTRTEFAPGFLNPISGPSGISGDYRLRFDSPLIDIGDATPLGTDETDLGGQARIVDGALPLSGPARDIGAYEYQRQAPIAAAFASPSAPGIGQPVSFSSDGSGDLDGDPVSFIWVFDDGAVETGATATHAFASDGPHTGTVTVTDATGLSSTDTATIAVAAPAPGDTYIRTAIRKAPPERSSRKRVVFKFRAEQPDPFDQTRFKEEPGATFVCSLDRRPFTACTSPKRYRGLRTGRHTFRVIATDAAGNVDDEPATDSFRIVKLKKRTE